MFKSHIVATHSGTVTYHLQGLFLLSSSSRFFFAVSSSSVSSPPLFFPWVSTACVWPVVHRLFLIVSLSLPSSSSLVVRRPVFVCFVACGSSFVSLCLCPIFCLPHGLAEFSDSVFSHPFASTRQEENTCFSYACFRRTSLQANTSKEFLTPGGQKRQGNGHREAAAWRLAWNARPNCGHRPCP